MVFSYAKLLLAPPNVSNCRTHGLCTVDALAGTVTVSSTHSPIENNETACVLKFLPAPTATPSGASLLVQISLFLDGAGMPITGTTQNGGVVIHANRSSPMLLYTPAYDADCDPDSDAEIHFSALSTQKTATVGIVAVDGSPGMKTAICCEVSDGFSILGSSLRILSNDQAATIELSCNGQITNAGSLGGLEGSSGGETLRYWDLVCVESNFANGFEAPSSVLKRTD